MNLKIDKEKKERELYNKEEGRLWTALLWIY